MRTHNKEPSATPSVNLPCLNASSAASFFSLPAWSLSALVINEKSGISTRVLWSWWSPSSSSSATMGLLGHVIGGAVFGLTARFWQLGILKRPMLSNPAGHVACTVGFAGVGYYWWKATVHMEGLLEQKEEQLRQRRAAQRIVQEALLEKMLADKADAAESS
ncbi:hypothetical protein HMN09_00408400 [Mycena chlorophos]|uniref:Uncharacterized protein n=1 Tax=Mycena chlorophos TaxID=658473 RepID=A0A8H6TDS0_MYCCL|nr:hypothetical protein HMN09_00408400 [Mycena chlorophos]